MADSRSPAPILASRACICSSPPTSCSVSGAAPTTATWSRAARTSSCGSGSSPRRRTRSRTCRIRSAPSCRISPTGVNMMANTAMFGVGVPLAPVTMLFGPTVTFVLVLTLGLAAHRASPGTGCSPASWCGSRVRRGGRRPVLRIRAGDDLARQRAPQFRAARRAARHRGGAHPDEPPGARSGREGTARPGRGGAGGAADAADRPGRGAAADLRAGVRRVRESSTTCTGHAPGCVWCAAWRPRWGWPRRSRWRSPRFRCGGSSGGRRATAPSTTGSMGNDLKALATVPFRVAGRDPRARTECRDQPDRAECVFRLAAAGSGDCRRR